MSDKKQGVESDCWPGEKHVSRADLHKNTVTPAVKGGRITVVNSIPKSAIKRAK